MEKNAVLIGLAYPEEFVAMIPVWYRKLLEWLGLVHDEMICMGHSALAIVHRETGVIEYADFGRYITPLGKGRTRTEVTDPDCKFDIKAVFDQNGKIKNEQEIIEYIGQHPEKTHGAGVLFASFAYGINYEKASSFIHVMNRRGSVTYDPHSKGASNCARFVYDTFKTSMISKRRLLKIRLGNIGTPSPLGIVFYGTDEEKVYKYVNNEVVLHSGPKFRTIIRHFFTKPGTAKTEDTEIANLQGTHHWLSGIGDSAWFRLSKVKESYQFERRYANGEMAFSEEFHLTNPEFDIEQPYKLIHDCNALWCTIEQNGNRYKLFRKETKSGSTRDI